MNNTELTCVINRFMKAFKAIKTSDEDVIYALILKLSEQINPELRALISDIHIPSNALWPSMLTPKAR